MRGRLTVQFDVEEADIVGRVLEQQLAEQRITQAVEIRVGADAPLVEAVSGHTTPPVRARDRHENCN